MSIIKVSKSVLLSIGGIIIIVISQLLAGQVSSSLNNNLEFVVFPTIYIFLSVFIVWIVSKIFRQGDLSSIGVTLKKININWIFIGMLLPITLNLITILLNSGQFKSNPIENVPMVVFSAILGGALAPGITEEVIFRGFLFTNIKKYVGTAIAVFLPSFLFAALHIFNGHLDFFSTILLLVSGTSVGIMFTMIRIATGSIWAGVAVHSLWDLLSASQQNNIFSIVPSNVESTSFFSYLIESKSALLSGGQYGIETSLLATVLYLTVALIIYYKIIKKNEQQFI